MKTRLVLYSSILLAGLLVFPSGRVCAQTFGSCEELLHSVQVEARKHDPKSIPLIEIKQLCTDKQVIDFNKHHHELVSVPLPSDIDEEEDE